MEQRETLIASLLPLLQFCFQLLFNLTSLLYKQELLYATVEIIRAYKDNILRDICLVVSKRRPCFKSKLSLQLELEPLLEKFA